MAGKLERSWERQRVCSIIEHIMSATDAKGNLHMHHCHDGNGGHDNEWRQHARDHGQQLLRVLANDNVIRCFKNGDEVTERQAIARTNARKARDSVMLAMESLKTRRRKQHGKDSRRKRLRKKGKSDM